MKKHLSIILTLALVAVLLPAAFAQSSSSPSAAPQTDQTSPSSAQSPSSQSPSSQSPSTQSPSTTSPSSSQSPSDQSPSTASPSTGSASSAAESSEGSFTGTVVKSGSKYVLKSDTGSTYEIDDQDKAKQFEGKQVKVSGTLDKTTSMLHVTDIMPADNR